MLIFMTNLVKNVFFQHILNYTYNILMNTYLMSL